MKAREARNAHIESAVESFRVSVEQALGAVGAERRDDALDRADPDRPRLQGGGPDRVGGAASDDTASNVNTVAAASEELTASIQEIARHVVQATTVVREAGATTDPPPPRSKALPRPASASAR